MHFLTICLLLLGSTEGSAETGNPIRSFTDEDEIKAVISQLEDALIDKDEVLVTACLSPSIASRKAEEIKTTFSQHVTSTQASSGKPLVCLQEVKVEVDGNKAVATLTAYSYGNGKRIKAIHKIPFKRGEHGWFVDDAEAINTVLAQVGGEIPLQGQNTPEEIPVSTEGTTPEATIETTPLETERPSVEVVPIEPVVTEEKKDDNENSEVEPTNTVEPAKEKEPINKEEGDAK